jgi:putative endonuclease
MTINEKQFFVYIMASRKHGTLYIGVTSDLMRRMWEHKEGAVPGFTKRCKVNRLVHYEVLAEPSIAIQREKSLKRWPRDWKTNLIERDNPEWLDLCIEMNADPQLAAVAMDPRHKA